MSHEAKLKAIEQRLQALEDHAAILNLLAGLPHSADAGDKMGQNTAYHRDCVMDVGAELAPIIGQEAIVSLLDHEAHIAAREAGMTHCAGLPRILADGDSAVASGYLQILIPVDGPANVAPSPYPPSAGLAVWRLTANRWILKRQDGRWQVTHRSIRSIPQAEARSILQLDQP